MESDMKHEFYKDHAGEWRWRITAANGNILAVSSEGYHNKADCIAAFDSVARYMVALATASE